MTVVRPGSRFGIPVIESDGTISSFEEKPEKDREWINGGFFVMEPKVFDYLTEGRMTILERKPFEKLANERKLNAYKHIGFWRSMDSLKDKNDLTEMWTRGEAPWTLWN
jgi:glucose-1-phosphate cytidylyltransferase